MQSSHHAQTKRRKVCIYLISAFTIKVSLEASFDDDSKIAVIWLMSFPFVSGTLKNVNNQKTARRPANIKNAKPFNSSLMIGNLEKDKYSMCAIKIY